MTEQEFLALDIGKFDCFSLSELDYYIEEGKKLMAKMVNYNPRLFEIVDLLEAARKACRY